MDGLPPRRPRRKVTRNAGEAINDASASRPKPEASYDVGYGKPPVEHRFKAGDGRKRGPQRGARNNHTILRDLLEEKVSVRENGRTRKRKKIEIFYAGLVLDAMKGNARARAMLISMLPAQQVEQLTTAIEVDVSELDAAIIADYLARAGKQ